MEFMNFLKPNTSGCQLTNKNIVNMKNKFTSLILNTIFLLNREKIIKNYLSRTISMSGSAVTETMLMYTNKQKVLEFGGGSSSILVSKVCKSIFVVDSEKKLVFLLKDKVNKKNSYIHYADIGPVGSFGIPFKFLNKFFKKKYHNYFSKIYKEFNFLNETDVVIIDGRFRVSCFLNALNSIKPPFKIIFDDYFSRDEYKVVENYQLEIEHIVGDCAVFNVTKDYREKIISSVFKEYRYDVR